MRKEEIIQCIVTLILALVVSVLLLMLMSKLHEITLQSL